MTITGDFRLSSCLKHYTLDQDKTVEPAETVKMALERLEKRFDLSNLKIEPRKDTIEGAYSFSSVSDQLTASGKGLTPQQSRASAIMEFTERYSWLHFNYAGYDGYAVESYNQIKGGATPTVGEPYFLRNFIEVNNEGELLKEILDIPLKWVRGISLMDYSQFYYPINWHNYIFTSNGLATGNAMEEAIVQALCEVIERENVYRLFHERRFGNDIDPNSIKNPLILRVLENAAKAGIEILIKDISFDFGIPTIVVQGTCTADKKKLTYQGCGYGTHMNPEKAVIRALAEYFESLSLMKKVESEADIEWDKVKARLRQRNYGFIVLYNADMLDKRNRVVKMGDLPDLSRPDIKDEIEYILKVLKRFKYNAVLIDKTHPELEIPVVRLFVPGFRSLIVNEVYDPEFVMAEAYFEAGNIEASGKWLRQALLKFSFEYPDMKPDISPKKVFKKDYIESLSQRGRFKKDALQILKTIAPELKKYEVKW